MLINEIQTMLHNDHVCDVSGDLPSPPPPLGWSEAVQLSPELTILRGHSRRHTLFAAGHTTGHPRGSRVSIQHIDSSMLGSVLLTHCRK